MAQLAKAHPLFCPVHLEFLQKQVSNVFFFSSVFTLTQIYLFFTLFIADRTSSSAISDCLCSAVVSRYLGYRCPY